MDATVNGVDETTKKAALARVLGPGAESVTAVAKEMRIAPWRLYGWRDAARKKRRAAANAKTAPKPKPTKKAAVSGPRRDVLNFADGLAAGASLNALQAAIQSLSKPDREVTRADLTLFLDVADHALAELRQLR